MSFRIQEIIKYLIPGSVVFLVVLIIDYDFLNINKEGVLWVKNDALMFFFSLTIVFVLGYLLDLIASYYEKYIYYKVFNKPALRLLNNTSTIKLTGRDRIENFLTDELCVAKPDIFDAKTAEVYFKRANFLKDFNSNTASIEKLQELYFQKIFSRNLSITILIAMILSLCVWGCYSLFLIVPYVAVTKRWQDQAMYYSRQVFYNAFKYK